MTVVEITDDAVVAKTDLAKPAPSRRHRSTGRRVPRRQDVVASLYSPDYDFAVIGDARRARRVLNAVREGFDAATFVR